MRIVRGLLVALVAALALAGCSGSSGTPEANNEFRFVEGTPHGEVIPADERQQAPNITGELLDESPFALHDYSGDIVVMNFWASWCGPCRTEAPDLQELYETYEADGVQLIGVLVRDSKAQGEAYSAQEGLTYPSLFDPSTKVALQLKNYPLAAIPSTIVFDRDGRVAAAYTASVNLDDLSSTIEKLLAE